MSYKVPGPVILLGVYTDHSTVFLPSGHSGEFSSQRLVDTAVDVYQKLRSCRPGGCPGREEDIENLRRFFKACADKKLGLFEWW